MKIGVLIIGSLYWDDSPPRTAWRSERLNCVRQHQVRVPIRYGRRSRSRGYSYTMVFSPDLCEDQFGTAVAIPFKSENMLEEEAKHLWSAEDSGGTGPKGGVLAGWGCVALLENPQAPLSRTIRDRWTARIERERRHLKLDHTHYEAAAVDESGFLIIQWPKAKNGSPLEMDALLATATRPTRNAGDYPLPCKIAEAWDIPDGRKKTEYFWCNRAHGITTFQDAEIEDQLRKRGLAPGGSGQQEFN
ncbi:MAG: hypothetical protein OXQ86_11600 [Gammaproteobacteria bacterium]|nr:hypothetical protein [Gammaproteobacteria bacterium]MDE0415241.1 hypothetical protein [Gammaproteobacteria bacterium]